MPVVDTVRIPNDPLRFDAAREQLVTQDARDCDHEMRVPQADLLGVQGILLVPERSTPVAGDPDLRSVVLQHERNPKAPRDLHADERCCRQPLVDEVVGSGCLSSHLPQSTTLEAREVQLERHSQDVGGTEGPIVGFVADEDGFGDREEINLAPVFVQPVDDACNVADRASGLQAEPEIRIDVQDVSGVARHDGEPWDPEQPPQVVSGRHRSGDSAGRRTGERGHGHR